MDSENLYNLNLKKHFQNRFTCGKLPVSDYTNTSSVKRSNAIKGSELSHLQLEESSHYHKDCMLRHQKIPEYESYQQQRKASSRLSGGDADRALYDGYPGHSKQTDSYRGSNCNASNNFSRHCQSKTKVTPALPMPNSFNYPKYNSDDANGFPFDTDSNIGGGDSEESNKSLKSSQTVVSKKSSQDLRKLVKSQCKLHDVIDKTLKQMCSTEPDRISDGADCRLKDQNGQIGLQNTPISCKRCTDKICTRSSQKDVMTEISKGDFLECRTGDTLTISVDDVVNSKVINPMIRKLQRMYLNNLREEMSLMEDLERLPHKVNEVYKATIFKQKE